MSALLDATVNEDIFTFGKGMTKSLHSLSPKRNAKGGHPLEKEIHELLLIYLIDLEQTGKYIVIAEHGADFGNNGFRIDIHLKPTEGDSKNHYLIEVKRYEKDDEGIYIKAIEGIAQMFDKTYYRHELKSKETTGIIMMGLAAHYDKICLISQKFTVHNGVITDLGTIRIQKFWINEKSGDEIEIDYEEPIEREIKMPSFKSPQKNSTDEDIQQNSTDEDPDKMINEQLRTHMTKLIMKNG
jgi:hypothetical protein